MPKKRANPSNKNNKKDDKKLFAFLAAFLSIIGFVIALIAKRNDKYVMFYAKQSLVVFIVGAILGVISWILIWIPVMGWIIKLAVNIIILVLWVLSWVYALSGKEKEVPVVGHYGRSIKL
ncbi:MAG: hypothetical protein PHH54_02510 [Candidatus Nanoarchaeia archaeon]|nr:hypothetical protein [Candidatus Nanoarchaeia archaeon]MDD5740833.1 hypothetical protein [Candidatus Nanoarchaeia archaeon]